MRKVDIAVIQRNKRPQWLKAMSDPSRVIQIVVENDPNRAIQTVVKSDLSGEN